MCWSSQPPHSRTKPCGPKNPKATVLREAFDVRYLTLDISKAELFQASPSGDWISRLMQCGTFYPEIYFPLWDTVTSSRAVWFIVEFSVGSREHHSWPDGQHGVAWSAGSNGVLNRVGGVLRVTNDLISNIPYPISHHLGFLSDSDFKDSRCFMCPMSRPWFV